MTPVEKAVWFIESHLAAPVVLDDVARHCQVSPFHLTRAFAAVTGRSLMRYMRARRLSEAARTLADGAPDILQVALEAGYGSHEAFSRAFRDQFSLTPEAVRNQSDVNPLSLVEPITMTLTLVDDLASPRIEVGAPMLLAGHVERFHCEAIAGLPALWERLNAHMGSIDGQIGKVAYGACFNTDDAGNFDYMAGVAVADFDDLPAEFGRLRVPASTYAVFARGDHIAGIRGVFAAIWERWLPESGREVADAPVLERYGAEFNPMTGLGGYEIWIPLKA
ncbi:AraC family transcriptional regulator [Phreatobacter aquaticus]|uniref:AraC family transcriptional regulator n=1 Tax=Phreatobacter aquaticus TaxID=2570229 RepID=A0A4D7QQL3_9HYPH|nr:AraC family transcriptional regulator [Phreatobacter aquaticus]QCK87187.1 AraC family transcriptional regulator [Phreatobacter aquaticus]